MNADEGFFLTKSLKLIQLLRSTTFLKNFENKKILTQMMLLGKSLRTEIALKNKNKIKCVTKTSKINFIKNFDENFQMEGNKNLPRKWLNSAVQSEM